MTAVQDDAAIPLELNSVVDKGRIEAAVREILLAVGEDPDRGGLVDTPKRVARAFRGDVFRSASETGGCPGHDL